MEFSAAETRLWHVTVTVAGTPHDPEVVRTAMVRLSEERPFLHALRFSGARAEIRYWEEGHDILDAASLALRVWSEHRETAGLPRWEVVGLEVLERDAFQRRGSEGTPAAMGVHRPQPQPF